MALKCRSGMDLSNLIHHSDRGGQYIDKGYVKLLKDNGITISMGKKAQDNAYAERVNGIIKNEYLKYKKIDDFKALKKEIKKAVNNYNKKRHHKGLNKRISPMEFEKELLDLSNRKRPKVIIYAEGNYKIKEASSLLDFKPEEELQAHNCPIVI